MRPVLAVLALTGLLGAACSSGSEVDVRERPAPGATSGPMAGAAVTTTVAVVSGDELRGLLGSLPADPALLAMVSVLDYRAVREALGWPDDVTVASAEDLTSFATATALAGGPWGAASALFNSSEAAAAAGLDPFTIDRHVSFGVPPERLDVLDMAPDVDVLEPRLDALGDESGGIWTFELDLTDDLGRILLGADTAGVTADRLVVGAGDAARVQAVLQGQPASPSLADDGALRAVLDQVGGRDGVYVTSDLTAPPGAAAPPGALLAGLGMDLVDGGTAADVVAAVVFATPEAAEAARDGYEEVLATGTSALSGETYTDLLGGVELSVEGPVVVARWTSATPAMRLVAARDLPLLWTS